MLAIKILYFNLLNSLTPNKTKQELKAIQS